MSHRPKHVIEYVMLRGLTGLAGILPLRAAMALGWLIGRFFFHALRYRRDKADERLKQVFGEQFSANERRTIAWIAFRNICFNAIEAARFHKLTLAQVQQMPFYPLMQQVKKLHTEYGPMVLVTIHMGNWDLSGVAGRLDGLPIFSIARRQKNPLTDALLNKLRNTTGMEVVLNDSRILQNVVRKLKGGEILAILPDVRSRESEMQVDFLGGKSSLAPGTALFAQMAKCPIVPLVLIRKGWMQHDAKVFPPIFPDPKADKTEDRRRIMQELMTLFETQIREHPEQYFWFNKRWVLDPVK